MRLIADSGSTKTDWALVDSSDSWRTLNTQGINPYHQEALAIAAILHDELLPHLDRQPAEVVFYGSGLRDELIPQMQRLLQDAFPSAQVWAYSDLLGAARAVCGREAGIAAILGTGANSCYYDGEKIVQNTPALGYILGDEGSGAVLGRQFLNALYKDVRFASLRAEFEASQHTSMGDVIERVYRQPLANRWLASLSPFIHAHREQSEVAELIQENFRQFFARNIRPYNRQDLPVGIVGSMAHYYREELAAAAATEGFTLGRILRTPLEGLVDFHQ